MKSTEKEYHKAIDNVKKALHPHYSPERKKYLNNLKNKHKIRQLDIWSKNIDRWEEEENYRHFFKQDTGADTRTITGKSYTKWKAFNEFYVYIFAGANIKRKPSKRNFKNKLLDFINSANNQNNFIVESNGKFKCKYREINSNIEYFLNKRSKITSKT